MARLPYRSRDDLPQMYREEFESDEEDPADVWLNVHRVLANNPALLRDWGEWAWALYDAVGDPRRRELAILTVLREHRFEYPWNAHVPIALESGISPEEIVAIGAGEFESFSQSETVMLEYVSSLVSGEVTEEDHQALEDQYSAEEIVALVFLATEYLQIGTMIDAFDVDLDDEFVGWELEAI